MSKAAPALEPNAAAPALDLQTLYTEYGCYVRGILSRLLGPWVSPDDLTQEVFIAAWSTLGKFRGGDVRAWLRQIAIHRAVSWLRRRRRWRFLGLEAAGELVDSQTPESRARANEATRLAYRTLERMSEKRRTVFILFELQGLSGEEIAAALKCPLQTVYSRLFHARREFMAAIDSAPEGAKFDPGS